MILELSLEKDGPFPPLDSIALNSNFFQTLSCQLTYECFLPARLDFRADIGKFEIERNALMIILSKDNSRIIYPFDVCRFHSESVEAFARALASYNFRSFAFLDRQHEKVFSNTSGHRIKYMEMDNFNSYLRLCREKDAIYPIFTCFDGNKQL